MFTHLNLTKKVIYIMFFVIFELEPHQLVVS